MASTRRRRLAKLALVALFTGCAHGLPNGGEWAATLRSVPAARCLERAHHNSRSSPCSKSASSEPLASSSSSPALDTWRSTAAVRRSRVSIARSTRSSSLRLPTAAILGWPLAAIFLCRRRLSITRCRSAGWDTSPLSRGFMRVTWPCSGWRRSRAVSSFLDVRLPWLRPRRQPCRGPAPAGRKIY
jgi:hypothetical protein